MLVGRVIQGAGGAVFPLAFGIIRDEFPPAEGRDRAIGLISAILGIGVGVGIVMAGPIVEHLSYHWLFWIPLVMTMAATVATFLFVPESPVRAAGRDQLARRGDHVGLAGDRAAGRVRGTGMGMEERRRCWPCSAVTAAADPAAGSGSRSARDTPMVDMKMMRIPAVWSTNLAALLFGFGMFAIFVIVPQFVQTPPGRLRLRRLGDPVRPRTCLPFAVAMLLIAPLTGRLTSRSGPSRCSSSGPSSPRRATRFLAAAHSATVGLLRGAGAAGYRRGLRVRLHGQPHHRSRAGPIRPGSPPE